MGSGSASCPRSWDKVVHATLRKSRPFAVTAGGGWRSPRSSRQLAWWAVSSHEEVGLCGDHVSDGSR